MQKPLYFIKYESTNFRFFSLTVLLKFEDEEIKEFFLPAFISLKFELLNVMLFLLLITLEILVLSSSDSAIYLPSGFLVFAPSIEIDDANGDFIFKEFALFLIGV